MYGDVVHAPLDSNNVTRCVDIGCGTGYVTNMMARRFPRADVIGLDLSPIPNVRKWEKNVKFFEGNVLKQLPSEWKAANGQSVLSRNADLFDLCWSRLLVMGMIDWPGLFKREVDLLKPGGWAECHELDGVMYDREGQGKFVNEPWQKRLAKGMEALGLDDHPGLHASRGMKEAGFVKVRVVEYRVPLGGDQEDVPFLKRAGDFWAMDTKEVLPLAIARILSMTGSSKEEVRDMVRSFQETFVIDHGDYMMMYVTYGQKPE